MNWKAFLSRILLVIVAFPLIGALIFLIPQLHHLLFNLVVAGASVVGALETARSLRGPRDPDGDGPRPGAGGRRFPWSRSWRWRGSSPAGYDRYWLVAAMGVILLRSVVSTDARKLEGFLGFASSSLFILLYPAFFLSWIVRFSGLAESSLSILLFLGLVFGNDMAAYFAGSLWGRSTRLNLPVEPAEKRRGVHSGSRRVARHLHRLPARRSLRCRRRVFLSASSLRCWSALP